MSLLHAATGFGTRIALSGFDALTAPPLSILIFHRVHARPDPLFPCEPDAAVFAAMMRHVARAYRVMTVGEGIAHLAAGTLPPRALAITFDDGYADNAEVALPILQASGLRATFFVSTGFLDGGRMWNDSVIECLRACPLESVELDHFGLGRCSLSSPAERRQVIEALLPRIKYLGLAAREEAVAALKGLCRLDRLPDDLMMRSAQVRELHAAGMEIGGHTVRHPILKAVPLAEAEGEIAAGKQRLQEIVDAPVEVFAFPNGKPDVDYGSEHVALLGRLGFRGAVSTSPGVARYGDDLFQLPRFTPWGRSLPVWALRLLLSRRQTDFVTAAPAA